MKKHLFLLRDVGEVERKRSYSLTQLEIGKLSVSNPHMDLFSFSPNNYISVPENQSSKKVVVLEILHNIFIASEIILLIFLNSKTFYDLVFVPPSSAVF